jgi:hypothetical protein
MPDCAPTASTSPPRVGSTLPPLTLAAPPVESDRNLLEAGGATFNPHDLDCRLLIIEVIGVYCPLCHRQVSHFNKVFERLKRRNLDGRVKMFALAAGGTEMEVEFLRGEGAYEYPVVPDESFAAHKLLGEPQTPFTLVVSKDGRVLYVHQGIIEDADEFLQRIVSHLPPD